MKSEPEKTVESLGWSIADQIESSRGSPQAKQNLGSILRNAAFAKITKEELDALNILEQTRPKSLRDFDQISMRGADLLCQVKLVASQLANKDVAFLGDHDGTSLLLGLLYSRGLVRAPSRMTLLDFDERLLKQARLLALEYGFSDIFEARPYNVFHPVPDDLIGQFDIFYTNPPYGKSNFGKSARLFIARGFELTNSVGDAGYMLLPADNERPWTRESMRLTQAFLLLYGWRIAVHIPKMHHYHLDDDKTLTSSLLIAAKEQLGRAQTPWAGRHVRHTEIPYFYGRSILPPYPHFIAEDGREIAEIDTLS